MTEPRDYLWEINQIPKQLKSNKLPYEQNINNILLFKKITETNLLQKIQLGHIYLKSVSIVYLENYN